MFGIRWRTVLAVFSLAILGAALAFDGSMLAAKDQAPSSTADKAKADKAAKEKAANKKKADRRAARGSADYGPSVDNGTGGAVTGTAVGGGATPVPIGSATGALSAGGFNNNGSGNSIVTAGPNGAPPGTGGTAPAAKTKKITPNRKATGGRGGKNSQQATLNAAHPLVKKVIDVQNRNQAGWLSQKGVAAVGTGLDEDGNVVIRVHLTGADNPTVPTQVEGVPISQVVTGPIRFAQNAKKGVIPLQVGTSTFADTTGSKGAIPCFGNNGTIGCRLIDSNSTPGYYALSCNHVFAGNQLFIGTWNAGTQAVGPDQLVTFLPAAVNALAPSGAAVGCRSPVGNFSNILGGVIGIVPFFAFYLVDGGNNTTLGPFYTASPQNVFTSASPPLANPPKFVQPPGPTLPPEIVEPPKNGSPTNLSDAAVVSTTPTLLDNATPVAVNGAAYIPTNVFHPAGLGNSVKKFGAQSSLTYGTVSMVNVCYNIAVNIARPLTPTTPIPIRGTPSTSVTNGTITFIFPQGIPATVYVPFSQQIQITAAASPPPFPNSTFAGFAGNGDSGALVVTAVPIPNPVTATVDPVNSPVGLLQAVDDSGNGYCGDFQNVLNDLVFWLAQGGINVQLSVDTSDSVLLESQDGKTARGSTFTP